MIKIRFIILACILAIAEIANAQQQVSVVEAKNAAINTLRNKTDVLKVSSDDRIKTVNSISNTNRDTIMYEVVFQNGATILLSGSKSCLPILGYYVKGDNGSVFDPNNEHVPCGLKALLKDYADEIEWSFAQDTISLYHEEKWQELQQSHRGGPPLFVHVNTLLTTKWGQQWANDGTCPAYNYYVTATSHFQCHSEDCEDMCPIGCTGVAMGQIMKYWNYPVYLPDEIQQYDWCNMSDELNQSSPNYVKERNAIARLLKDCADEANASYCLGYCMTYASAIAARSALVKDFGYSKDAVFRLRSSHPINLNNVWIDYLRVNLNKGRPILYGSLGLGDGHYWVCDGYGDDGNGNSHEYVYFHFNFGNTGSKDGWYTVNNINSNPNWNLSQEAVFDIYPSTNENYCNYTFSLDDHFAAGGTHQNVPKTYMKLETASATSPAAWRTIQSGQSAEYVAHESIRLLPGFKAEAGSHFVARIEPCANCNSAKVIIKSQKNGVEEEEELYIAVGDNEEQVLGKDKTKTEADEPQVYPNPTTGLLTIDTKNGNSLIQMIELYNMQGAKQFTFSGNYGSFQEIDISHLPSQVYILKIQISEQIFTKKLILQK